MRRSDSRRNSKVHFVRLDVFAVIKCRIQTLSPTGNRPASFPAPHHNNGPNSEFPSVS